MPRFDSASVFGALLGDPEHGRWSLRPADAAATATRAYATDTFTLVTRWTTADGEVEVTELMPVRDGSDARSDVIRRVRGLRGTRADGAGAPRALRLRRDAAVDAPGRDDGCSRTARRRGTRRAGGAGATHDGEPTWPTAVNSSSARARRSTCSCPGSPGTRPCPSRSTSTRPSPPRPTWWRSWVRGCIEPGAYDQEVRRSLLVLRLLTHEDTGGIVAAATTSLPEDFGGSRNWDYRYVWLRDAALTLEALVHHGYTQRGAGVAAVAAASDRGGSRRRADHVRSRGGAAPDRVGGRHAARVRGRARPCASATRHPSSTRPTSSAR